MDREEESKAIDRALDGAIMILERAPPDGSPGRLAALSKAKTHLETAMSILEGRIEPCDPRMAASDRMIYDHISRTHQGVASQINDIVEADTAALRLRRMDSITGAQKER